MNTLSISIVTVCRNAEATIARTIESIRAQQYPSLEYIVIDGASTDSTPDIVRSYSENVDIFISEPDSGIADAFNKGICRSTDGIIGLINADDQLCPGTLEKICCFFEKNPYVDVIHGDVILVDEHKTIKRVKPAGRWWYPWRLVLFNHPATFVRKSVYEKHGLFDTSYRIAMDVELFLRWTTRGARIHYLPEILVNVQAGGASSQQAVTGFQEVRRAALHYGFSPLLVHTQYSGKIFVWWLLKLLSSLAGIFTSKRYYKLP